MSNPPNTTNGSATPGDIGTQLALIQQNVNFIRIDIAAIRRDREADEAALTRYQEATEMRLRTTEATLTRLSERMTIWQGLQAALTLAVGALAAYLGATLR